MLFFDENIPLAVVEYFRNRKNKKVASIIEERRGLSDYDVLALYSLRIQSLPSNQLFSKLMIARERSLLLGIKV